MRDPRFDDLSGEYKEDIFKSTYSFLSDVKQNEKQVGTVEAQSHNCIIKRFPFPSAYNPCADFVIW